ncbi:TlpA family protein disulfide reductase [Janthinobacterium sp. NFX145]|uniref:TlpA family protein disulfide reductase n=1 Tax=Janthinobacterium sp. NFX145 TaxID=3415602 RepID=UPI003CC5CFF5
MTRWPALLLMATACHANAAPLSFDLPRLDGDGRLDLGQLPGQPVVLNFWASNCLPCIRELPIFNAHAASEPGLTFIGIAIDTRAAAQAFLRQHPASYPQALASPALLPIFGNQIKGLPYTVILTSQHQICTRRLGAIDAAWLAKAVAACARP